MSHRPARERRAFDIAEAVGETRWQQPNSLAWLTDNIVSTWRRDKPRP